MPCDTILPERPAATLNAGLDSHAQRFELGAVLGQGGMGIVRLARQTSIGRSVAIKSVRTGVGTGNRKATRQLLQEAWTTGLLEHPNIVPIYDVATDAAGDPFIVLKRIEGEPWADLLEHPERAREEFGADDPLEWSLQVFVSVCNAVHFAHDRKILHLDLKPENVMLGHHGEVYVVDWGIALALEDDGSGRLPLLEGLDSIIGTPNYMAPEMATGRGQLSEQTDIYLLGATLYEVLFGRPPHDGESIVSTLHDVLFVEPQWPEHAPIELTAICRKAMAREPCDRFPSALAFRRAIEAFVRHRESGRIGDEAAKRLEELQASISQEPKARERSVLDAFKRVRFGFEQALASWAGNERARRGLAEAFAFVVDHELDHGTLATAEALASSAGSLPEALQARVDEAVSRRQAGLDELVARRMDLDPRIGQRTRAFVLGLMGLLWTMLPLLSFVVPPPSRDMIFVWYGAVPATSLLLLGLLSVWARESLMRTHVNRIIVGSLFVALGTQVVFTVGAVVLRLEPEHFVALVPLLFGMVAMHVALAVERRAVVVGLGYFACFLAATVFPKWGVELLGVGNFVLFVVVLVIWWPARLRGPIEIPSEPV